MPEYKRYIRCHIVKATPMTRGEYNKLRGWEIPANENPADEGYHVVYPDGYKSWCPKAQFEDAGRPVDGMTFGMAIEAMKKGKKVARRGWNGKGMWLCIQSGSVVNGDAMRNEPAKNYYDGKQCNICAHIDMKAADDSYVVGWLASQTDMLSDDWVIVE